MTGGSYNPTLSLRRGRQDRRGRERPGALQRAFEGVRV